MKSYDLWIYNRWGQLIYTADNLDFEWDGTYKGYKVQDGTYVWKISYTTRSGREEAITGHINLIR